MSGPELALADRVDALVDALLGDAVGDDERLGGLLLVADLQQGVADADPIVVVERRSLDTHAVYGSAVGAAPTVPLLVQIVPE